MEKSILKKQLEGLNNQNHFRFHMPGHKGRGKDFNIFKDDITEINGADNLHDPQGVIAEVQEKIAEIYGSEETAILINGSTAGIHSAILGACKPGETLLVPANCHRSVFGALALGRIQGVFINPLIERNIGFAREITLDSVKEAIIKYPNSLGMVLTNPTYYGTTSDVKAIAETLHSHGKFLIVDEAHGAHLHFNKELPKDAIEAGADVVIQSTHKILGSLTQSALIHFQGNRVNRQQVKVFLSLLQSSSPSYPLMISVEEAVDTAYEKGEKIFGEIIKEHEKFYQNQDQSAPVILYEATHSFMGYDRSKWLFQTRGVSGNWVAARLLKDYGIQCELSGNNHVLAMTGMGTTQSDLKALTQAVKGLNTRIIKGEFQKKYTKTIPGLPQKIVCTAVLETQVPLWEGLYNDQKERRPLEKSGGCLAGEFIIPYPPGIPVMLPGSRMTKEIIDELSSLIDNGVSVVGINTERELLVLTEKGVINGA